MKRLLPLLCFVVLFVFGLHSPAQAAEEILKFHSDIKVQTDGSMVVTENITVKAEGRKIRRGIYRDFPTAYKDRLGNNYRVDFEVLEVLRDNKSEPYHTESQGNGERVYIGSADTNIRPGVHIYTLKYRTDRQLGFFEKHDELYWNVTGNGWEFPIREAYATLTLPGDVPSGDLKFEAYTGPRGATQKNYQAREDIQGRIQFWTTRRLNPREGLTIVVGWPKGLVQEPSGLKRARYLFEDNFGFIAGVLGWAIIFLYYFLVWLAVGKDPEKGVVIPRFAPPKNFSPAVVRYVRKMGFDNKAFAAALINLAVKGYITIQKEKKVFTLEKVSGPSGHLLPGEKKLFASLPDKLELKKKNHAKVRKALKALKNSLSRQCERVYFLKNSIFMVPGVLLTLGVLFLMALSQLGVKSAVAFFLIIWITFWSFGVFALVRNALSQWKTVITGSGNAIINAVSATILSVFSIPFIIGEFAGLIFLGISTSFALPVVLILLALTNYLFYRWLKAPTHAGRKILDEIDGFRMFLTVTEEERLNLLNPPDRSPELFEKYLPYALALDVEQLWAEQFSAVLAKAGEGGQAYAPAWYSGGFTSGNYGALATSLGNSFTGSIASSSTAPGSSSGFSGGGGGGGSSGGGGGGGGGGGW